jgi:signal transduction histidine kinase
VDRRTNFRRSEDRITQRERIFLARSLDILAVDLPAETRLAALLRLLARTVGARRAAVVAGGSERRVAASVKNGEEVARAQALATWLDAQAPRTRAERATATPAAVSIVVEAPDDAAADSASDAAARRATRPIPLRKPHYACVAMPSAGQVALGFEFGDAVSAASLSDRLPRNLARHAAVALALVTEQVATAREVAALQAHETERTRFVSTVAHDLRTPLTGLGGYLELILSGRVDDENVEREFLERSLEIVGSMTELVGDLLELSRLESGTLTLEIRAISVQEVGQRVVDRLTPIAVARGIDLRADLPPRLKSAAGDRRRVEQVLTNLCGNALKFTAPGGLVEICGWFAGPVALIAVRDDGAGIGPDDRARIFERFYRMSGHDRVTGTGLGLPIARELAQSMGGDLDVASVSGSGSSFVLALPGTADMQSDLVTATLEQALLDEEMRIEERAVVRAIQGAGRRGIVPIRAVPSGEHGILPAPRSGSRPRPVSPGEPVRLRSIEGSAGRNDAPDEA